MAEPTDLAESFMALPEWQNTGNDGRRALIRDFAVKTRDQFETPQEQSAVLQKLWEEQSATNTESVARYVGTGIKEAALSLPSLAGAAALAAGDAVGLTDSGSGERFTQGVSSLLDQTGQRIKSLDPNDSQEVRDAGLQAFKADLDSGSAPQGVEDWLSGKPLEELDETSRTYVQSVTDALAQAAVVADHGVTYSPDQVERFRNSDRSLLFSGGQGRASARELLADYVATKDPSSWSEFTSRATETDAENTKALRDQVSAASFEAGASPDGFVDDLTRRSMSMQGSPLDLGTAVLPVLFGAKALAAAKAGNTAGAVRTAATGIATGAAEEGATTFLTDADAPLSQIASDAGLGAIGEGAFTAAGAGAGALMRDRPIQQFVSDVPSAAPPPPAAVAEAIAVSTGDPAAAEVIRQAATVAETLSTVPQGEALRADLAAVDLSTPITDSYLGLDPLEVDALEVAPAEEVTEEITTPVVEDLSVEPTPDGGFVGEAQETTLETPESPLEESTPELDTTLVEPTAPVEGDVASVSGAQPLTETVAEPTPQDVEADEIIAELNSGTDYNLQREPNPDPAAVTVAAALEGMTGRKTVFVRGKPTINGGGKAGRNTIVVNLNSRQPLRYTLGHEITHSLIGTPEYTQLSEVIKPTQGFEKYREKLLSYGYADSEIEAEFVADVVGENLANRAFWRSLSTSNPTVFQRVADTALDFIETVWNKLKDDKRPSALKYLEDLQKSRDTIREVLTGMRERQNGIPENQLNAGGETLVDSLGEVGTETVTETAPQPVAEAAPTRAPLTEQTLRDRGADPDKWSPEARVDAVKALNGDEVAFSRLNRVQKSAVGRTLREMDDSVRESRSGPRVTAPQQRFSGQTTFQQEVIGVEEIQGVVDTLLENKTTIANATEAVKVLSTLGNGATTRKVNAAIRSQFGDYLNKIKDEGERALETDALRSFVYAATIGRTVELAAKLQLKGGPSQKKTAAKLLALATDASRLTLVRGSLDSTTAARVLRFSQLANGGDVAALLAEINDQVFKFLEAKTGITPEQAARITKVGLRAKPAMAEVAAYSVTPEGRKVIETRKKVQTTLDAFAKFVRSKVVKQSREEASMSAADRVDALVATVREDYSNIEDVLQKIAALLETLPLDAQVEAGQRLDEIMSADEDVAKAEVAAGGKARKIDTLAKRMIADLKAPNRDPKRKLSQTAADFAAIRKSVRDQTISPSQGVEAFEALGGDPALSGELLTAFESDVHNTLHNEALAQDAQRSKDLVREIGEKVAKEEDFAKRVQQTADAARKKTSDDLIAAVGADVAREESFQKRITELADAAAKKAEEDARKAEKAATGAFGNFNVRPQSAKRGPSLTQSIMEVINSNPLWDISSPEDQQKLMAEILKGKGFDSATIAAAVKNSVDSFNAQLEKLQRQEATKLIKELQRGKVTQDSIFRAIRLNILSPEKGIPSILAAIEGWKGLSDQDLANLYEVGDRARQVENQQVRVSLLIDQLRIIYKSTGLSPELKDTLSAGIRASAYGGLGSLFTNATAPATLGATQLLRELVVDVVSSPTQMFESIARHTQSFVRSVVEGYRSANLAFRTESTKAFNVSKDTAEKSPKMEGIVDVDALTRLFDKNLATIRDPKSSLLQKTRASIELTWSSQRIVWKVLGAADSFGISLIQRHLTELNLYRAVKKDPNRPDGSREQFDVYLGAQKAAIRYGVEQLKLSPIAAQLEAETRTDLAYFQWLKEIAPSVVPEQIRQEALREAVSLLGNHAEVQGRISWVSNKAVEFFSNPLWNGLGSVISGPIRIIGNIADMATWWFPGYGIYRAMREKARHARDDAKLLATTDRKITPAQLAAGIARKGDGAESQFSLHALSDWQLQRRMNEGLAGSIFTAGIVAALAMQPSDEDEQVLEITNGFPTFDPKEQARWRDQNLKEYTVYIGRGKDRTAVAFTRGAFDYLTFPLAVGGRVGKMFQGKTTATKSLSGLAWDIFNLSVPTVTNNAKNLETLRGGGNALVDLAASRLSAFQPYSGLTRSIAKLTEEPINKDASGFQFSQMAPITALISDVGEVELRNVLNEPVELNNTWYQKLAASGFPIYVSSKTQREDPEIRAGFSAMNYSLPTGYTFNQLEKDVEGREQEVLSANGAKTLGELYQKMNAYRAVVFKEVYKDDPKPGKQADDQRYLEEIIEDQTPEGQESFKQRMSTFWSKATREMKAEFQLEKDE